MLILIDAEQRDILNRSGLTGRGKVLISEGLQCSSRMPIKNMILTDGQHEPSSESMTFRISVLILLGSMSGTVFTVFHHRELVPGWNGWRASLTSAGELQRKSLPSPWQQTASGDEILCFETAPFLFLDTSTELDHFSRRID
jgi:hypothetical protein